MRLDVKVSPDPGEAVLEDFQKGEKAVTSAMRSAALDLKNAWRKEVQRGGLGRRLANTVRSKAFPERDESLNAAALVWTKAPEIVRAHDTGALIRSADGFYLAIPTEAAGTAGRGRKMSPGIWEDRNQMRLRFVYRRNGPSLLVADDARLTKKGIARKKGGRRRKKDGILSGAQTVVVFILLPQVSLRKRTNLLAPAARIAGSLPGRISANWDDT